MKIYVGVTDYEWYNYLARLRPEEANFWRPSDKQPFRVLQPNELFLFKLHYPRNYIVGGGLFVRHSFLPVSLAWEAFGNTNGAADYHSFLTSIHSYRRRKREYQPDPSIGCIILSSPFFFDQSEWIQVPADWSPNIVQGKTYDTETAIGRNLYMEVVDRLQVIAAANLRFPHPKMSNAEFEVQSDNEADNQDEQRYGTGHITYPRLGQGGFKIVVTEAYQRRCAITGEKTLPVLEAAHIKPYAQDGPHKISNGLLLRKDLHALFDRGYITFDESYSINVSDRIKHDYGNGRDYYAYHGKKLIILPDKIEDKPSRQFIRWHNENVFIA